MKPPENARSRTIPRGLAVGAAVGASAALAYGLWKRSQRRVQYPTARADDYVARLLVRAAPYLRLPTSPDRPPEVLAAGEGLRCPVTGRVYPYRDGILDLLPDAEAPTVTQQALDSPFTAWAYDRFRGTITDVLGIPDFPVEVAAMQATLEASAGDVILDLACGHGNFTLEWAKRVGPDGLVIGLDYSPAMLARAAYHVDQWEMDNVLLVHGDAQTLPLADRMLEKVTCAGGFHQFPDLPRALQEIARVTAPGGVLTASTFATRPGDLARPIKRWANTRFDLHFVDLVEMGAALAALGYTDYSWTLPGGWFGYAAARRTPGGRPTDDEAATEPVSERPGRAAELSTAGA